VRAIQAAILLPLLVGLPLLSACARSEAAPDGKWNPSAAASYLDRRAEWWLSWKMAARDRDTVCVSCHTALPYALSRAALRTTLAESGPTTAERRIVQSVATRVQVWNEIGPYYSDESSGPHKTNQARGSESVINALVLATVDAAAHRASDLGRLAFDRMWGQQESEGDLRGAWRWLDFGLKPWEAEESAYFGAALAALAVGTAPDDYRATPAIQPRLQLLRDYLEREYPNQTLGNRVFLLWASTAWRGLLRDDRQQTIVADLLSAQHADGAWSMADFGKIAWSPRSWIRRDMTPVDRESDACATGLAVYVLARAGLKPGSAAISRGGTWLAAVQDSDGFWRASSLNKRRDASSEIGRFMTDAATAYAVLALAQVRPQDIVPARVPQ
jgi:squalene-hopene/tetraprenyl-beta-curcumene cyclase